MSAKTLIIFSADLNVKNKSLSVQMVSPSDSVKELENGDAKKLLGEKEAEIDKLRRALAESEKQLRIQTQVKIQYLW